jgi:hypothetical protein
MEDFMLKYKLICLAFVLALLTGCQSAKVDQKEAPQQENSTQKEDNSKSEEKKPSNNEDKNQSKPVDLSFFDNAVFVGDSVTLKLKLFVINQRKTDANFLGEANFLVAGSLGWANLLWEISEKSVHPAYNGQKMLVEDAIAEMGAKKAMFMLGENDIGLYGVEKTIENAKKLLDKVKQKSPDIKIYIQSVTPMVKERQLKDLNNPNIEKFNVQLRQFCEINGYAYWDVAAIFKDADGALSREDCSDPDGLGIHFTDAACKKWVKGLEKCASET